MVGADVLAMSVITRLFYLTSPHPSPKDTSIFAWFVRRAADVIKDEELRDWQLSDPCVYCYGPAVTLDHIVPKARGGTGRGHNLAPACRRCNTEKDAAKLVVFLAARNRREVMPPWRGGAPQPVRRLRPEQPPPDGLRVSLAEMIQKEPQPDRRRSAG